MGKEGIRRNFMLNEVDMEVAEVEQIHRAGTNTPAHADVQILNRGPTDSFRTGTHSLRHCEFQHQQ
jgi:hypothetical protein